MFKNISLGIIFLIYVNTKKSVKQRKGKGETVRSQWKNEKNKVRKKSEEKYKEKQNNKNQMEKDENERQWEITRDGLNKSQRVDG